MRTVAFANGDRMPLLGLGTWKSAPGEVGAAVREAIRLGYRHIDCASVYANEPEVGEAIRSAIEAGEVRREELWITSKLWCNAHGRDNVEAALRRSLADLGLEWLDLYLIHWPVPIKPGVAFPSSGSELVPLEQLPLHATWEGMEAALEAGLTRHIGVSNFSSRKLHDLLAHGRIRPEVNQVERHPLLQQPALVADCAAAGVHITAYSPLGSQDRPAALKGADEPVLLENPVIGAIAAEHGCSPAQVLIAWQLQGGISTIPKSVRPARLRENLAAAAIELTAADLERIAGLDQHRRLVDGSFWLMEGSPWTLQALWDEP
ncbi:aldo/keto reductase [Vulcanococcus limneticus]|uniref:aldo/keto reductase n=1 Tax=Vulcanococcus limneticus TaxID=2170428 RepID=UPI00398BE5C5